ncbi:hypothetical protein B4U79_13306 [Dinothrombium tinctorium]|uniref:Guanylate cyclase n=1 Tax=Dinothrombium tinctorium TaxID=1965070 RepID=A0A443RGL1_9ACAR|nr:hypothetical protein B4U79_13306 [Dinothrombium tinctorium]
MSILRIEFTLIAYMLLSLLPNGATSDLTVDSNTKACVAPPVIRVGYLTNMNGRNPSRQGLIISGAISYAISKINANASLLAGSKLELMFNDTKGETLTSTNAMLYQWRKNASVFFGPEESCAVEATIATALNLPMISYKCSEAKVSNKRFYSTFARTIPQDTQVISSLIALFNYYKWVKFSIVYEDSAQYKVVAKALAKKAREKGLQVKNERSFENIFACLEQQKSHCLNTFSAIVEELHTTTRVWVFLGLMADLGDLLRTLRIRNLLDHGEHIVIYIGLEPFSYLRSFDYIVHGKMDPNEVEAAIEAAKSLLVIVSTPPSGKSYSEFEEKVREYNSKEPFNFPSPNFPTLQTKKHVTVYASYLYDAVMLYADALATVLRDKLCYQNGTEIINRIIKRKRYRSVTGAWMNIDSDGNVEGNYTVLALQETPAELLAKNISKRLPFTMLPVGSFDYDDSTNETILKLEGVINWVGGKPPLDEPPCGFNGSACLEAPEKWREITAGILAGIFLTTSFVTIVTYRNWKYEKEIAGLLWQIYLKDLHIYSNGIMSGSKMSLLSGNSQESRYYAVTHTQTAFYKGTLVAMKELLFSRKSVELPRETKKEMKLMKELHHDNVNPFIGAHIDPNRVVIITEYCAKGSLQDVLENQNLKLDCMFIASLVFDLISAMIYLHESDLKVHGNLKSSNCLITSRWALKVTDYGLHQLRVSADVESTSSLNFYRKLLWTAPELIKCPVTKGTQKGDVYSFGIILHEIFVREGPFCINSEFCTFTEKEIIHQVKECKNPDDPFRPEVSSLQCQDYIIDVMRECWEEKPEGRPDFPILRQKLKKLRQGLKPNIMDNMMAMMEKYANNLEELVEERTAQNGDKHASEIASMALELLESVKTFKIRHRSNDILQLRIGIHSGPVVAGVVGTTMPRYCLFGDTVNTASRMESNGEALKIHISSQCRDYLTKIGGYQIVERGLVRMKGKGEVKTYWLIKHTNDVPNRRDHLIGNEVIKQTLFAAIGNCDYKKLRSQKILNSTMSRKGSSIVFKEVTN